MVVEPNTGPATCSSGRLFACLGTFVLIVEGEATIYTLVHRMALVH